MNYNQKLDCFLSAYLDAQIKKDEEQLLPSGSEAISFKSFVEFLKTNEGLNKAFFSAFEEIGNVKLSIDEYKLMGARVAVVGKDKKLLDDFIINKYFSSKCVIESLARRDKIGSMKIDLEVYISKLKNQLKRKKLKR